MRDVTRLLQEQMHSINQTFASTLSRCAELGAAEGSVMACIMAKVQQAMADNEVAKSQRAAAARPDRSHSGFDEAEVAALEVEAGIPELVERSLLSLIEA